ncbi:protein MIZU-KUSSEI 1-like [Quillaja saponaria]|uniref:Protein MIZU-KUSSEI 1-like n=1 Tax=Quillaja saponaria TaxID=32244 RepID=A0AAD7KTR9_QUISA|nr:protein MIZU-KUSSEI 1-like [Quillaja saponaria]
MAYPIVGATNLTSSVTAVDCQKQVRSWRLLRALMELLIPTCNRTLIEDNQEKCPQNYHVPPQTTMATTLTGTIFGYRHGKVSFCIQTNSKSTDPILLLELAVSTTTLAKEMQGGSLRIVLESASTSPCPGIGYSNISSNLLSTPVWAMYCNGRKVGYAIKRRASKSDLEALRVMDSVIVGAGSINGKELNNKEDDHEVQLMYLRARFQRVSGSANSQSFHLNDPEGNIGQELSIFFFRSSSP